jgi:hypothetical protein
VSWALAWRIRRVESALGIAADDQDLLAHIDEGGEGVLGGRRLPDPSLAIKRDLTQVTHVDVLS